MTKASARKKENKKPLGDLFEEIARWGKTRKDYRYDPHEAYEEEMMERLKRAIPALWRKFKGEDRKRKGNQKQS